VCEFIRFIIQKKKKGKRSFGHGDESSHFIEGGEMLLSWKTRPVTFPTGTPLLVGNMSLTSYFRSVTVRGLWLRDNLYTECCRYLCQFIYMCEGRSDNKYEWHIN
jgi:hypothetical protein